MAKKNENSLWSTSIWPNDNIAEITTYMGSCSLQGYAKGFLEIASIAIEKTIENNSCLDLVMPAILYNIRHSLELFLKFVLSEILKGFNDNTIVEGHKIKDIFDKYEDQIKLYFECNSSHFSYREWLNKFKIIVNKVNAFDPDGQTMRYPTTKIGVPNLSGKVIVSGNYVLCLTKYIQSCYDDYSERDA